MGQPSSSSLARRHGRRRTTFAVLPAAPAAPLPKKFFDTFWEPYICGPPSSLKRVKACKGRRLFTDTPTRKISPLGQSRLLLPLGRNDNDGIILRDPFDCAARFPLAAPLRVKGIGATRAARPFCHPEQARAQPARVEGSLKTNILLVIPSGSRGILYRTQKLFRTRLYSCLPPRGKVSRSDGRGEWGNAKANAPHQSASPPASPTGGSRGKR